MVKEVFANGFPIDVMFGFRVGFPVELKSSSLGAFIHALLSLVTLA